MQEYGELGFSFREHGFSFRKLGFRWWRMVLCRPWEAFCRSRVAFCPSGMVSFGLCHGLRWRLLAAIFGFYHIFGKKTVHT
ncbi:MAG: hypothetical protein IKN51_06795, partial [Bacteroidaceae bacterium]|nr:hypothetical protein [Bacteroidaceae bacterium]